MTDNYDELAIEGRVYASLKCEGEYCTVEAGEPLEYYFRPLTDIESGATALQARVVELEEDSMVGKNIVLRQEITRLNAVLASVWPLVALKSRWMDQHPEFESVFKPINLNYISECARNRRRMDN